MKLILASLVAAAVGSLMGCPSPRAPGRTGTVIDPVTAENFNESGDDKIRVVVRISVVTGAARICVCLIRHNFLFDSGQFILENGERLPAEGAAVTPNIIQCKESPATTAALPVEFVFDGLDKGATYSVIQDTNCDGRYDDGVDIVDSGPGNVGKFTTPR